MRPVLIAPLSALHLLLEPVENLRRGLIARLLTKSTSEMRRALHKSAMGDLEKVLKLTGSPCHTCESRHPAPAPEYKLTKTPGNLSSGKLGKLFVRLKLGLIGFVLNNVR